MFRGDLTLLLTTLQVGTNLCQTCGPDDGENARHTVPIPCNRGGYMAEFTVKQ